MELILRGLRQISEGPTLTLGGENISAFPRNLMSPHDIRSRVMGVVHRSLDHLEELEAALCNTQRMIPAVRHPHDVE